MDYILMNKDVPCALFSCEQDEFGEESAILREWYTDLRPIGLQSLTAFICTRAAVIPMRLSRCLSSLRVSLRSRFVHRLCITIWGSIIKN